LNQAKHRATAYQIKIITSWAYKINKAENFPSNNNHIGTINSNFNHEKTTKEHD
jgi:hypothetical protein